MSVSKTQLENLKRKIIEAFTDVSYPNGVIAPHECDKCRKLRKTFYRKNWKTIDSKILEENYSKLPLFSSEAFQYFLPAYLIYSLENFNDNDVCEFTIYNLSESEKELKENLDFYRKYFQERFGNFTMEQVNSIYEFLSLVESEENEDFEFLREHAKMGRKVLKEFIEPTLRK